MIATLRSLYHYEKLRINIVYTVTIFLRNKTVIQLTQLI